MRGLTKKAIYLVLPVLVAVLVVAGPAAAEVTPDGTDGRSAGALSISTSLVRWALWGAVGMLVVGLFLLFVGTFGKPRPPRARARHRLR